VVEENGFLSHLVQQQQWMEASTIENEDISNHSTQSFPPPTPPPFLGFLQSIESLEHQQHQQQQQQQQQQQGSVNIAMEHPHITFENLEQQQQQQQLDLVANWLDPISSTLHDMEWDPPSAMILQQDFQCASNANSSATNSSLLEDDVYCRVSCCCGLMEPALISCSN